MIEIRAALEADEQRMSKLPKGAKFHRKITYQAPQLFKVLKFSVLSSHR